MPTIAAARAIPYVLPLVRPVTSAQGCTRYLRGWLLRLEDGDGRHGWGEALGWPGFGSSDAAIAARLAALSADGLVGRSFATAAELWTWLDELGLEPEVSYALELAVLDLLAQARALPLAALLATELGVEAPARGTAIVATTHALALGGVDRSAGTLKIKVGGCSLDDDETLLADLRARLGAAVTLRLDAGAAWSEAEACRAIDRLARYDVAWIEQPIAPGDPAAMARVRRHAHTRGVRIALDESVPHELEAALAAGAADGAVIKPMFVGGLGRAARLLSALEARGVEAWLSCALESAIGRAGTIHLAALVPGTHGLGGAVSRDVALLPPPSGDAIALPYRPGLGIAPDPGWLGDHGGIEVAAPASDARAGGQDNAIPNPLASAAVARPDHPALVSGELSLSYRELSQQASALAAAFAARGIAPGMTVGLSGPHDARFVVALHALAWLGAVVAPLPHEAREPERRALSLELGCQHLVDSRESEPADTPLVERFWPLAEGRFAVATSGTLGARRSVVLGTQQIVLSAFGSLVRLGHDPADRWLCCLPLHHVAGLSILLRCAFYATTVVLEPRFDAARVNDAIDGGAVSLLSLVPGMLARLIDERMGRRGRARRFPPSLRAILVGGAALDQSLFSRARALGAALAPTWGMTEAASQIATLAPGDDDPRFLPPLAFARAASHAGRLVVRGPLVGGELVTSDLGKVDERGWVEVSGRADDVIVRGGEKLVPAEIERALREHPLVAEALVVGVPCPRHGQRPAALLVARGAALADDAELEAHCRERLSRHKLPALYLWCSRLPRTALGKPLRRRARALAAEVMAERESAARAPSQQTEASQSFEQRRRRSTRGEGGELHAGMHHERGGAQRVAVAAQPVAEGQRPVTDARHLERHVDPVVEANGRAKVGFGVHQRQADAERLDATSVHGHEHLFEGGVAVLEHAPEKDDACPIDFEKPRRHAMNERHDDERR
jgi:O-succinylbenzoic acid--CoA ligase